MHAALKHRGRNLVRRTRGQASRSRARRARDRDRTALELVDWSAACRGAARRLRQGHVHPRARRGPRPRRWTAAPTSCRAATHRRPAAFTTRGTRRHAGGARSPWIPHPSATPVLLPADDAPFADHASRSTSTRPPRGASFRAGCRRRRERSSPMRRGWGVSGRHRCSSPGRAPSGAGDGRGGTLRTRPDASVVRYAPPVRGGSAPEF